MNTHIQTLERNFGFPFPKASVYAFYTNIFIGLLLCYTAYDRIREYDIKGLEILNYLIRQSIWVGGLGIITISVFILLISEGIIIDFQKKRYKTYFRILGFRIGKWENLFSNFYISMFKAEHNYSYSYAGNMTGPVTSGATGIYALKDSYFEAYIYEEEGENRILISKGSKEKVIEQATEISNYLDCELIVNE